MSTLVRAAALEPGHVLADPADLAELASRTLMWRTGDPEQVTVNESFARTSGTLVIGTRAGSSLLREPDRDVLVAQDVAPSVQLAAVMPKGWQLGARSTIAEYWSTPRSYRSTVAQVLPAAGGLWHACVSQPGRDLLNRSDIASAADAVALAVQALTEALA